AFTQAFGSEDLDASNLMLAITRFLPGDDPRMKATIDATAARLTDERGLVYRYLAHDGLAGGEGTFLLCTFWLAQAQALAGAAALRAGAGGGQRGGLAGRGERRGQRRNARQLPAAVQPHRPGHRGLGDRPGPGGRRPPRPGSGRSPGHEGARELTCGPEQIPHRSAGTAERALRDRLRGMTLNPAPTRRRLSVLRDFGIELVAPEPAARPDPRLVSGGGGGI